MEPSSLDKLVRGIWEQIHGSLSFDLKHVVSLNLLVTKVAVDLIPSPHEQVFDYAFV